MRFIVVALLGAICLFPEAAPALAVSQSFNPPQFVRGLPLEVTVSITRPGGGDPILSLGFEQSIPSGWTFDELVSTTTPLQISPPPGDEGLVEFAFSGAVVSFPQSIIYRIRPAPNATTSKQVSLTVIGVTANDIVTDTDVVTLEPDPDGFSLSMDVNQDGFLSLSELIRLVQLYNANEFHCSDSTEDGFAPGNGARACGTHSSDYLEQDWMISLSELVRGLQLFRYGFYILCENGEDLFCSDIP